MRNTEPLQRDVEFLAETLIAIARKVTAAEGYTDSAQEYAKKLENNLRCQDEQLKKYREEADHWRKSVDRILQESIDERKRITDANEKYYQEQRAKMKKQAEELEYWQRSYNAAEEQLDSQDKELQRLRAFIRINHLTRKFNKFKK
jgi:chromosome segregation ATPase